MEFITIDLYLLRHRPHYFSTIIVRPSRYEAPGDDKVKKASYLYNFEIVIRPADNNLAD